jgi:protoheme IX farnesyltransferase
MDLEKLKAYYYLTKPGIIYANVITAVAGYLFGSQWHIDAGALLGVTIGTSLVIAGACTYNNILDIRIDTQMKRTQNRALVTGAISRRAAGLYASLLVSLGFAILAWFTNLTVFIIGLIGLIDYVVLYGWAKRHSSISTIVGSVSGSTSIVAGYCAATGSFDAAALLLFAILTIWQMPHFYAIAMYRKTDYAAASLPLMPLRRRDTIVRVRILAYIVALILSSILLTTAGYAGWVCMVILVVLSGWWLLLGLKNYRLPAKAWGKQMFLFSLAVNLGISLAVAIGSVTP